MAAPKAAVIITLRMLVLPIVEPTARLETAGDTSTTD
jgi:hypothetical protein